MQILKFVLFRFSFSIQGLGRGLGPGVFAEGLSQGLGPRVFAEGLAGLLQVI